ncbi:hypothetical protein R5W24_001821 [Gemmata sp. JC717]|uniref:hypothetical protein n=1 Tax=Gemmata algarum TaxID=2975278 RepID=UPI0021BABAF5|nr:hypothetical protein [Gemmata algarum]MDY3552733.1 hypothetical protein [Gemmata algarum]
MRVRVTCPLALLALLPLGCSRGPLPDDALPTYPITGTLTWKGRPMDGAAISFVPAHVPEGRRRWRVPAASGRADVNGRYTLNTYLTGDGAPAGEYLVVVCWPEERNGRSPALEDPSAALAPDRLKLRFADPKKPALRANVESRDNVIDFHLSPAEERP